MAPSQEEAPQLRSLDLMDRAATALLVIDVQERLLAAQPQSERIVWNCRRLAEAARAVGVSTAATIQAPSKLGPMPSPLTETLPEPIAKVAFSACEGAPLAKPWAEAGVRHVLVAGVETHVCVLQTALDLLAEGFQPTVCVDAVGSRFEHDHEVGLRRMEASGVVLTTAEAAMFEWCRTAADDAFRTISALAKEPAP
ncbi:MAG: isochorismatase family protein [Planctomycetota bacterium]